MEADRKVGVTGRARGSSPLQRKVLGLLLVALCTAAVLPTSVRLMWDRSPSTNAVGYAIYYGVASGVYTQRVEVGHALGAVVTNLESGTRYYFAATAYNDDEAKLESEFSNEVEWVAGNEGRRPAAGQMVRVTRGE